jgi:hypothetical protein
MKHQIQHDLDAGLAKTVADRAFESYRARFAEYRPSMVWTSDGDAKIEFQIKGFKLSGGISVRPRTIDLELDVPFIFRLFKSRALDVIEREVRYWIGKAKAGELYGASS